MVLGQLQKKLPNIFLRLVQAPLFVFPETAQQVVDLRSTPVGRMFGVFLAHQHRVASFRLAAVEVEVQMDPLTHLQEVLGLASLVALVVEVAMMVVAALLMVDSLAVLVELDAGFLVPSALAIQADRALVGEPLRQHLRAPLKAELVACSSFLFLAI